MLVMASETPSAEDGCSFAMSRRRVSTKQAGIKVIELPNTLVSDIGTMDEKTGLMTLKFQNANPGDKNPAPADVQVTHIFQATGHWDEPDKFQTNDPTLNISAKQSRIIQYPVGYDRLRNEGVFEGPADIAVMGSGLSAIDAAFAVLLHPDVGTLKWQGMTPTYIPKQPEGKRITVTCYSRRGVWPKVRPDFTEPFVGSYTSPGKYEEIRHLMNNDKPLSLEACIKLLDMEMAKAYDRPVAIPKRSPGQSEAEYAKVVSLFRVPADQKQPLASVEYLFDPLGLNDKHPERKKDPADPFKLVEADIMFADNGDYASTPEQPNVRWYEVIHNLFPVLTRAYRGFTPEERERFDKDYNTNFLWAFAPMTKRSALTIVALHKAGVLNLHRVAPPTSTDKTPNPTVVKEGANVKSVTWKYIDYDRTVKTKSHPFMAVTTGLSANITQDISPLTQNQLKSGGYTNYDLTMASGLQKREGSIFLADDDTYEILDQKGHHSPARRGVGFFAHSNIWAIQAVPAVVPHAAKAVRLYVAEFAARVNGDPLKAVLHQTSYDPAQDLRVALQHAKLLRLSLGPAHEPKVRRHLIVRHHGGSPVARLHPLGCGCHVSGVHQPQAKIGHQVQPAGFVQQAVLHVGLQPGVRQHPAIGLQAPDPGRGFELDEHALRPVLKEPAPVLIGRVVAVNELDELVVLQQRTLAVRERSLGLCAVVAHVPVAARVQPEPAKTVRHIGPLGHRGPDDIVHIGKPQRWASSQCPTASGMARTWPGMPKGPCDAGKPTWPPCPGCQSVTYEPASCVVGKEAAGTKGSLRALSASAGTRMSRNTGLAEARDQ